MQENYYDILEINYDATEDEIKKAYRKKAKIFHPDKDLGNEEIFRSIDKAYKNLIDPEKRKKYDNLTIKRQDKNPVGCSHE